MAEHNLQLRCEFVGKTECVGTHQCEKHAEYLVITQIPPYVQTYTCYQLLAEYVVRLLGMQPVPVIVRRHHEWTIEL